MHAEIAKNNDVTNANQSRGNRDQQIGATHLTIQSGHIGCRSDVSFPDLNSLNSRGIGHLAHLFGSFLVKKLGDIFSGRINRIERRLIVQELMVDVGDEIPQDPLEVHEIKKEAYGIELFAFDFHTYAIVVAVGILTLAPIPSQGVSGRECLFYADFKHRFWADRPARRVFALARRLHEALNFSDVPGEAVLRQRFNKNLTILHTLDAVIEDGEYTAVGSRANQPAETLL